MTDAMFHAAVGAFIWASYFWALRQYRKFLRNAEDHLAALAAHEQGSGKEA